MSLTLSRQLHAMFVPARYRCAAACLLVLVAGVPGWGQQPSPREARARRFLAGRSGTGLDAARLDRAKRHHLAMLVEPRTTALSANWTPVGPGQIASLNYGNVTGRVTSLAIDPADSTGNTVYLGTTGGGLWRSTNAAAVASTVSFTPLTDTLAVFSPGSAGAAIPSLSIGAVSVSNGVILAGTGDPNDALDSYYGNGILRSSDGGTTWTLIQQSNDGIDAGHSWFGLGFAGFAWSGTSAMTVVAAVSDAAEGTLVNAPDPVYSTRGLYVSNDAGATWQMATIMDGSQVVQSPQPAGLNHGGNAVTAVVWNPLRQRFYAAVRFHGYYESADGTMWTRLAAQPGAGLSSAACPPETNIPGSEGCPIFRGALAVEPASGDMYAFTVDARNLDQGIWRDACNPSGAGSGNTTTGCAGAVAFGTQLDASPLEAGSGSTEVAQGDYDLSLAAVASGTQTLLFAGTVDLYRCALSTASSGTGGCSFRNATNVFDGCVAPAMVAPAQHALAALASEGPLLYVGNDGGVWRSTDGVAETGAPCSASDASHFQNLNGGLGSLAEVISFAEDPTTADTLIVAVGANGSAATSAASAGLPWPQLAAGEGGYTAIDPANPANWYISTGPGVSIRYCGNGAQCGAADFAGLPTVGEAQVDEDASVIDAPWILDPALPANVAIGTCRVWRGPATDGSSWSGANSISAEFGGNQETSCGSGNAFVRSLAAGGAAGTAASGPNAGSKVLYAGMAGTLDGGGTLGGHVFSTAAGDAATGTTAWADLALSPVITDPNHLAFNPGGFDVSSVALDPHDATGGTVYATIMGFAANGVNVSHLYRSVNGGADWLNISNNLPDAPANSVVVDPNDPETVYVAMDTGVYATTAVSSCTTGNCWSVLGTGLPDSPVVELEVAGGLPDGSGNAGLLRAATYGRGIWQIPLLTAAPATTAAVGLSPASLSFAAEAVGSVSSAQSITVTNTGTATVVVSSVSATGDFTETDDCAGMTLAVGAGCAVQVDFAATAVGSRSGTLTVVYQRAGTNTAAGQATAELSGIGESVAAVTLVPLALSFGSIVTGTSSPSQTVTLSNAGGSAATLGAPSITGDFALAANTCGVTLAAGAQCSVGVVFAPAAVGTLNGTLSVSVSTATATQTQTASLTGVGASAATDTVTPGALNFGQQQESTASSAQTIMLTNSGDATLTGISVAVSGAGFALTNGCGSTLAGHSACAVSVTFTPGSVGSATGTVTVTDALRAQTVLLAGVGYPAPQESVTPASLSFGPTAVGVASPLLQLTVANSGGGVLPLGAVTVTGDFAQTNSCTGGMLGAGIHCAVNVVFTPAAVGTRTGSLTVAGAAPGSGVTVALTGVGATVAAIGLSPASLSFPAVTVGLESGTLNIAVSNTGGLPGTLGAASVTGDFELQSDYCGTALNAGAQCSVGIVFIPTASGTRTGTFTIPSASGVLTATLTGTGAAPATDTLSPASLTFAAQQVGTASAGQTILLTNSGDALLTGVQTAISPPSFTLTNGCGTSLPGHSQCALTVGFDPTTAGTITGTLIVGDQSRPQPQTVPLSGTGLAPAQIVLTPSSASFGSVVVGSSSAGQNIAISNIGGVPATLGAPMVSGDFAMTANTCGATLAPGVGCTVTLVFSPTAAGARSGRLTIAESSGSQSATPSAALAGTGLAPATDSLSPLALNFAPQGYGTVSAAQNLTLTNTGDAALVPIAAAIVSGSFTVVNNCGGMLAGHSSCTLAVAFAPSAAGPMTGVLSVSDPLRTQTVALSGTGTGPPLVMASPAMLTFAPIGLGVASPPQTVTVSNAGGGTLTIGKLSTTGDFTETDSCASATLNAGGTCTAQVVFSPTATGTRTGTLVVSAGAVSGAVTQTATVALSGTGAAPATIVLTPASLNFGTVTLGSSASPAQNITISNTGGVAAMLGAAAITGDFYLAANTCGATLPPQTGCTVAIGFTPAAAGMRTGTFSIAGPAGTQTATLTGMGASAATDGLSPLMLSFAAQQVGTTSVAQAVTLTNSGDNSLTLVSAQITSGDFAALSACGPILVGHASCTIAVSYAPTMVGPEIGVLTVSDQVRSQTVALSGTGIAPPGASVTPASLTFAALGVGQTSAAQTLTVSNRGGGPLAISGITANGDFSLPAADNTCGAILMPSASCTAQVVFTPTVGGQRAGSVSLADNAPGSPQMVTLTGTGVDFSLASDGPATATISSGGSGVYGLLLSSATGVPGTATFACSGAPANATCTVTPADPPLGSTTVITVTIETGVVADAELQRERQTLWLATLLLGVGWLGRRRLPMRRLFGVAAICGMLLAGGCGSSRVIPPDGVGGGGGGGGVVTPPGTYAITVIATSAGLSRTVTLLLVVQ